MTVPRFSTRTGARDTGSLQPRWPLSADAFEDQMNFLVSHNGFRCVAHDRRGHGRSSHPFNGNDLDTYADDLAQLVEYLNLSKTRSTLATPPAAARWLATSAVTAPTASPTVLLGAIPPLMLQTGATRRACRSRCSTSSARATAARSGSTTTLARLSTAQPPRQQGLQGPARLVLAAVDERRLARRPRLHQGLLRVRLHRGPEEIRHPYAHPPRRRRPDRPHRRRRPRSRRRSSRTRP